MTKAINPFQALVAAAERLLAKEGIAVTSSPELPEPGEGSKREIDVLIEGEISGERVRIALECRDHQATQDIQWIDALIGKYQLLGPDIVIAVSRSGFSAGALQKAALHGIRTLTVSELEAGAWPSGTIQLGFRFLKRNYVSKGVGLVFEPTPSDGGGAALPLGLPLFTKEGAPNGTLGDLLKPLLEQHLPAAANEIASTRAHEVLISGVREVQPFTVTLTGGGYFRDTPEGRSELVKIDLHGECDLVVEEPDQRHFGYRHATLSVARALEPDGRAIAVVALQDPNNPGVIRARVHQGNPKETPG